MTAPAGYTLHKALFASYGTPTGSCHNFNINVACNSASSIQQINFLCSGRTSCTIDVSQTSYNAVFGGDPCVGTAKHLYVKMSVNASTREYRLPYSSTDPCHAMTCFVFLSVIYSQRGSVWARRRILWTCAKAPGLASRARVKQW